MNSFYRCTALIIPVLTTLLQLKYQGTDQNNSPFTTHPRTMGVAASSSAVYYLSYIALLRRLPRPFDAAACLCLIVSGYASVASLTSLLFLSPIRPFVYSVFALISAAELLYYYKRLKEEEGDEDGVDFQALKRSINNLCRVKSPTPLGDDYLLYCRSDWVWILSLSLTLNGGELQAIRIKTRQTVG